MDSWFGMERLTQFLIAFVIVLALIAVFFWLWRRLAGSRIGGGTTRGRPPRLAVIDAAAIDGRRRLVLIRRDNVEHLLMIGGPTDVVIEQNIVRAVPVAAAREASGSRGMDAAPRLPEIAPPPRAEPAPAWPMQPEPAQRSEPEPAPRPQRAPRAAEAEPPPMVRPLRTVEPEPMPRAARMPEPEPMPRAVRMQEPEPMPRSARLAEPETATSRPVEPMPRAVASGESVSRQVPPERPAFRMPPPSAKATAEPLRAIEPRQAPATAEDNLADMAQRLEAALRRPRPAAEERADVQVRPAAEVHPPREAPRMEPQRSAAPDPARAAQAETKPDARPASPKSVLDSLEQEMASLLGRPAGRE